MNERAAFHDDETTDDAQASAQAAAGGDDAHTELERLRSDVREAGDRVLRAQAELENYRKRARRELDEEKRYANLPLLRDLLPALDNVQRAIVAAEKTHDVGALLDGIKMVAQNLVGTLARHDCLKIEALHKPFDPAFQQAIAQVASDQFPPHTVTDVAQDGYVLHERVVRPAQVVVSKAPE